MKGQEGSAPALSDASPSRREGPADEAAGGDAAKRWPWRESPTLRQQQGPERIGAFVFCKQPDPAPLHHWMCLSPAASRRTLARKRPPMDTQSCR